MKPKLDDLISRETVRRIIISPRNKEQMLNVLDTVLPFELEDIERMVNEIKENNNVSISKH